MVEPDSTEPEQAPLGHVGRKWEMGVETKQKGVEKQLDWL